jgi:hypothetical protein
MQASSTMHCRIKGCFSFWTINTFKDYGIVPHAATNKATLPRKRWRSTFAHYP